MSPEEYAALKAAAAVKLYRDSEGNYLYDANEKKTGVLPRDIIEQLETLDFTEATTRAKRHDEIRTFISDLKEAQ
jgi:hypothetical protein